MSDFPTCRKRRRVFSGTLRYSSVLKEKKHCNGMRNKRNPLKKKLQTTTLVGWWWDPYNCLLQSTYKCVGQSPISPKQPSLFPLLMCQKNLGYVSQVLVHHSPRWLSDRTWSKTLHMKSNQKQEVDSYIRKIFESKNVFIDHLDQVLSFRFLDIPQRNLQDKFCTVYIIHTP